MIRLIHPALDLAPETPLAGAEEGPGRPRLTDRARVGLLLQGAAVLAHLDTADGRTARGWKGAGIGPGGELCGLEPAPGRRRVLCQQSLRELLAVLFSSQEPLAGGLSGRGEARRAVRRLLVRWRPSLAPLPPHRAVTEILEVAPFLWDDAHARDRRALAAELDRDGVRTVLLAGAGTGGWPRWVAEPDAATLREVLAGADARRLWNGSGDEDPERLAALGRWRRATAVWAIRGPADDRERLAHGEALLADGRFAAAAEVLLGLARRGGDRKVRDRALAGGLRARLLLGELEAVRRRLGRLAEGRADAKGSGLSTAALLELADVAQRAFANGPRPERAAEWADRVERALADDRSEGSAGATGSTGLGAGREERALADLIAAGAAWDRGDRGAIDRHLAAARPMSEASPAVAWRWHQVAGLRAMAAGDGPGMVASFSRALATDRRSLRRDQAAGLWSDLGVGRVRVGDLAGAERAFLHAQRLLAACDGPRRTTLALYNLAEVRVRRGRLAGVEEIVARSLEENRLSGNVRGQIHDLALSARYELALGRPEAALVHCADARALQEPGSGWHGDEIRLLEARALGWLGRSEEAARALAGVAVATLVELEPEERPALFALAGLRERALAAAAELDAARGAEDAPRLGELWAAVLAGEPVPSALWGALDRLEPYGSARAVYDLERVRPGSAPAIRRRRAVAAFRRIGASELAWHLELADGGAWKALGRYLERPSGEAEEDRLPALRRLFEEAGLPEVRIERRCAGRYGGDGSPEVLIGGEGGGEELSAPCREDGGGRLVLRAGRIDATVRALFALAVRELAGPGAADDRAPASTERPRRPGDARAGAVPSGAAARVGIVGDSPALRSAVARAERLGAGELPILITGESGTGKELMARLVHRVSERRAGELVAVNCAALSENLLLSDLFGHVRGAFTGADRDRAGVFESARGGTVFLDEIGDLPLPAQGTLLRVLQEGEVRRLGESLPRAVDARLIAATHRDLGAMVEEGSFRRDLFFRLSVASIELPPLRERHGDALTIADRLLADLAPGAHLSAAARDRLASHPWPGNVRELKNVLEVAVALSGGGALGPEHLELAGEPAGRTDRGELPVPEPTGDYHGRVEAFRRRLVSEALEASGGNRAEAARRLGLSRQALSYLAKQLRIH